MRIAPILILAALAGCAPLPPPPDTARLPPGVFGPLDQDVPATQFAQHAFSDPSHTFGDPAAGAQAVLAMEYIAGQLSTSPRWASIGALTQDELLQGRADMRQAIGIAPGAPSQLVVDSLVAARNALASGDTAQAAKDLDNPAFPAGGAHTVQVLGSLPYIRMANVATQHAAEQLLAPDDGRRL